MKNLKLILKVIIAGAIIGFVMSILKHTGYWSLLKDSLKSFNIILYILSPFFFFFLAILVHELGHLLSFVFSGIKIRALFVLVFIVKRNENNKWRFNIKLSNIKLLGGLVVPNLPIIENDEQYNKVKSKFTKALIAGPIISIIYLVISILMFIIFWFFTTNYFLITYSLLQMIFITLMTILILMSSKVHTDELYGDFVAYKKFREDEIFALAQISQYTMFSLNDTTNTDKYIIDRIVKIYQDEQNPKYKLFDLNLISTYINNCIFSNEEDLRLDSFIKRYNIDTLSMSKNGYELGFIISAYYYRLGNVEQSYKIYNKLKNTNNRHYQGIDDEIIYKVYAHLINLEDNNEFINNNIEEFKKSIDLLLPVIDFNKIINDRKLVLPFIEYSCPVVFKEEEVDTETTTEFEE